MTDGTTKPSSAARQAGSSSDVADGIRLAKLLADEARNKAMLDAMPDLMFGFSRAGVILYYNAPDEGDLYREPHEFIGRRIDEVVPSGLGAKFREIIRRTLETDRLEQFEYQLLVQKGVQEFEARMVVSGPDEVLALVRNITARKRAEEATRRSERTLRSITEHAIDSIFIKDAARRYTFVNPAMEEALGLPKEDILGRTPEEVFGPEQAHIVKIIDDRTFSGETVDETRILVVGDDERCFHTLQRPLAVENGEVTSILGIVRDVTERARAEKRDLHDSVGQQLTGLRFLLAALHRELSATHPEAARRVSQIEQIAADAFASVRQITEGIERLSEEPDTLDRSLRKLAYRVSDLYGIQCRFTSRKPVLVRNAVSANHLFLIAQEAVVNAVKHAKPSRIAIALSKRNNTLRLVIRDDGVGFTRKKKSKGIGLSIMQRRATLIGASFDVQAGKTGGTVVTCSWKMPPK